MIYIHINLPIYNYLPTTTVDPLEIGAMTSIGKYRCIFSSESTEEEATVVNGVVTVRTLVMERDL